MTTSTKSNPNAVAIDMYVQVITSEHKYYGLHGTITSIKAGWATVLVADNGGYPFKARLKDLHEAMEQDPEGDEQEDGNGSKLAKTIAKYRAGYVPTLSASGKKSLSNGDALAMFLSGLEPSAVCSEADRVLGEVEGFHWNKYTRLNKGQQRMNAGNRIRAAIKRGDAELVETKYEGGDIRLTLERVEQDA